MTQPNAHRKSVQAWQRRTDPLAPKAGDLARDFELRDVNGENLVRLSDFQTGGGET